MENYNIAFVTFCTVKIYDYSKIIKGRSTRVSGRPFFFFHSVNVKFGEDGWIFVDFYFYEYLSNMYKRGFIEMHFNWCELMNDNFFGAPMRQGKLSGPCPYPPGAYNLYNMSIDIGVIPRSFPFTKGRIYANLTYKHIFIGAGYIDMEVKEVNLKRRKNYI
ncbi:hypothetical protein ABMA27_001828 [Loxostege sticticalis]|uniref:Uncharacterized protein n=1 Tax=Loxostege sticticalis TaxID=481309 RepID=A0ABR3HVK2_LOXSC